MASAGKLSMLVARRIPLLAPRQRAAAVAARRTSSSQVLPLLAPQRAALLTPRRACSSAMPTPPPNEEMEKVKAAISKLSGKLAVGIALAKVQAQVNSNGLILSAVVAACIGLPIFVYTNGAKYDNKIRELSLRVTLLEAAAANITGTGPLPAVAAGAASLPPAVVAGAASRPPAVVAGAACPPKSA